MRRILIALLLLISVPVAYASGLPDANAEQHVHVSLIPDRLTVRPGGSFTVAVAQQIAEGWHTYWKNPGEAGYPTTVTWHMPKGWKAGAIQWPYPQREQVGPLMDYGYRHQVWLLTDLSVPADAKSGRTDITADVAWLACLNVCVPENATVKFTVFVNPLGSAPYAATRGQFSAARAKLPTASPWPVHTYADGDKLVLSLDTADLNGSAKPKTAVFFPDAPDQIVDAAPQSFTVDDKGLRLSLTPAKTRKADKPLTGVLVLTTPQGSVQALNISAKSGPAGAVASAGKGGSGDMGIWLALVFAFIGGLILNIMPCVLPVLAMKAMALANHAGSKHARAEAFTYCFGAIISFVALGLLLAGLRASGAAVGWGFQLQDPIVVTVLALLLFAVGLNFYGVFEINPVTAGEGLTRKSGLTGAFFTGVLAVAVAAPCSAPFMATAVGFGMTQPAIVIIGIFLALGIGFALPFLLIGAMPALTRFLPKPGNWMVWFRKILSIPMFGATIWLLWVLGQQVPFAGMLMAVAACIFLGLGLWLFGAAMKAEPDVRRTGLIIAVIGAILCGYAIHVSAAGTAAGTAGLPEAQASQKYTPEKLSQLRAEGKPVFVDASASWCITCLVNEKAALDRPNVQAAFRAKGITTLVADWTNRDPEITRLLETHGRSGVPLYLYYAPGAKYPQVLPQILTEGLVLKAIGAKG